jgi:hypothetical protein
LRRNDSVRVRSWSKGFSEKKLRISGTIFFKTLQRWTNQPPAGIIYRIRKLNNIKYRISIYYYFRRLPLRKSVIKGAASSLPHPYQHRKPSREVSNQDLHSEDDTTQWSRSVVIPLQEFRLTSRVSQPVRLHMMTVQLVAWASEPFGRTYPVIFVVILQPPSLQQQPYIPCCLDAVFLDSPFLQCPPVSFPHSRDIVEFHYYYC